MAAQKNECEWTITSSNGASSAVLQHASSVVKLEGGFRLLTRRPSILGPHCLICQCERVTFAIFGTDRLWSALGTVLYLHCLASNDTFELSRAQTNWPAVINFVTSHRTVKMSAWATAHKAPSAAVWWEGALWPLRSEDWDLLCMLHCRYHHAKLFQRPHNWRSSVSCVSVYLVSDYSKHRACMSCFSKANRNEPTGHWFTMQTIGQVWFNLANAPKCSLLKPTVPFPLLSLSLPSFPLLLKFMLICLNVKLDIFLHSLALKWHSLPSFA